MTKRISRTDRARSLRRSETKTEKLLWSVLRGNQVCGLKFRRQHSIGTSYVDFACISHKLVVEVDGGYHDAVGEADLKREAIIKQEGWDIIRFTDRDVEEDPEAVARGIASRLGLEYEFRKRSASGSGMENVKAPNKRLEDAPPRPFARPTLPHAVGCQE